MTLKHYLHDLTLGLAEKAYWALYLSTTRCPRLPAPSELVQLEKDLDSAMKRPDASFDVLVQVNNALQALKQGVSPDDAASLLLSLSLWAALHRYRARKCPLTQEQQLDYFCTLEPLAWRWDDARGVLLLDMAGGLSLRLWLSLSLPRRLSLLKPSHAHTLSYDVEQRILSNGAGECVSLAELVRAPSTHVYLTRSVARFFPKPAQLQVSGPRLSNEPGKSGQLF